MAARPEVVTAFRHLAESLEAAVSLCAAAGHGKFTTPTELRSICTAIGFSQSRSAEVERALRAGASAGVFAQVTGLTWRAADPALGSELAPMLEGALLYRREVHQDENLVDVVLTRPPPPSLMSTQLDSMLGGGWGLRDTRELLPAIAESATTAFTVMSPYLDELGAAIVRNLFEQARVPQRHLVLRVGADGKPPPGLSSIRSWLGAEGVEVWNFRLVRPGAAGYETFHAKVVLADADSAYVGSSNMHRWSFDYSLELGFYVRGRAAARVADIASAIRAVSVPMPA